MTYQVGRRAHVYPFCVLQNKTEGKRAPLRRELDNDLPWPDDLGDVRDRSVIRQHLCWSKTALRWGA